MASRNPAGTNVLINHCSWHRLDLLDSPVYL